MRWGIYLVSSNTHHVLFRRLAQQDLTVRVVIQPHFWNNKNIVYSLDLVVDIYSVGGLERDYLRL
jgi:hypothetical protein